MNAINFPENTRYSFQIVGNVWFVCGMDKEGELHKWPYNAGKFTEADWRASPEVTFWDWSRISRNERKSIRSAYLRTNTALSVQDYRAAKEALKAVTEFFTPEIDNMKSPCPPPATTLCHADFVKAKNALERANVPESHFFWVDKSITLGNCTTAATPPWPVAKMDYILQQEQGNNPMRIDTVSANATVAAVKSDEAFQREYLLDELEKTSYDYRDPKMKELAQLFNLNASDTPQGAQALIDAITGGKYTTDAKKLAAAAKFLADETLDDEEDRYDDCARYVGSLFYGLTFTDLPTPDRKGYDLAVKAYQKARLDTKRQIIVGSPADGLAALLALEAWMPGQNAPSTTTVQ